MIAPARLAAFEALLNHHTRGTALPVALAAVRQAVRDARDQTLLTELVNGTVRMRLALDYQLSTRVSRPLATVDPPVLVALRLGAFQLLYLDRLPASAVVNDAVSLTRRAGTSSASGLVNAVLRALARERGALVWPSGSGAAALAVRHSHPEWLVRRWLGRHGPEATERWLTFNNDPPRLCLAVNRARATRDALAARLRNEGVDTRPTARSPRGLHVDGGQALATGAFADGWFVVQDEASQLIADLADVHAGHRVLDVCAAPGGKTMALAECAGPAGLVVACDVRPGRVRLLQQTLARTCPGRTAVVLTDPHAHLPFAGGHFDTVLVDAPCSGLGTIRRDPDIRWARQETDLAGFAARQGLLLHRAASMVRAGGRLVYATCSSEPEENDEVVAAFLSGNGAFRLVVDHRTLPPFDGLEAFYGAVLARNL